MALKPWHKVVSPREDLREDRPLDASEFAVHLDQIRDGRAPVDYQNPARFFDRTHLTRTLTELAGGVIRRLAGQKVETSPVYNLATQFGGGKTHALALLYHLASAGPTASSWRGVADLLDTAGVRAVPRAATAVFVGTEFDSTTGRGGDDGTPLRRTPWGEIAWQLGGQEAFAAVARHEEQLVAPAGDVIRKLLPPERPTLLLLDELMNYVSRSRKSGLGAQFYNFLHSLTEEVRGHDNVVLVVSVPASELEMTAEDLGDYDRIKKLLDRTGKAMIMAADQETTEIIRRRLFDWSGVLPEDGRRTAAEYAAWVKEHRSQLSSSLPADQALEAFAAAYPFHPTVLSVFERKWRALPRFQQTRGVLRMLALWVARAYQEGYKGGKDPLITLGTAPLDDARFRPAVLEQLGETGLEGPVTTDICGKKDSIAVRLDKEAVETLRKARLHRKVATAIFFESNGGQARAVATLPEVRLAVAEPDLDIGNIETAIEGLAEHCYFLTVEKSGYRFSTKPNVNKIFSDRRASVTDAQADERVRDEVRKEFSKPRDKALDLVLFPQKSGDVPDRAALTLVVVAPDQDLQENGTRARIEAATRECGASGRTFKTALIWLAPENVGPLRDEARRLLGWEAVKEEEDDLRLDETQRRQVGEGVQKAGRDLRNAIWRAYKTVLLFGRGNELKASSLGQTHASAAESLPVFVLQQLLQNEEVTKSVGHQALVRKWNPTITEWSTRSVRDTFFASPEFPRLIDAGAIKDTIARGVTSGDLALVTKGSDGGYANVRWNTPTQPGDVEISEDLFVIRRETAKAWDDARSAPPPPKPEAERAPTPQPEQSAGAAADATVGAREPDAPPRPTVHRKLVWEGEIQPMKWMNLYRQLLTGFVNGGGVRLRLRVEIEPPEGLSPQRVDETRAILQSLNLDTKLEVE